MWVEGRGWFRCLCCSTSQWVRSRISGCGRWEGVVRSGVIILLEDVRS